MAAVVVVARSSSLPSRLHVADPETGADGVLNDGDSIASDADQDPAADRDIDAATNPEALLHLAAPSTPSIVSWIWKLLLRCLLINPFRPPPPPPDHATTPASERSAGGRDEGRRIFTAVLAILPLVATAMGAILPDMKDTVGGWSAAPRVAYGVAAVAAVALMAVGVMAVVAAGGGDRSRISRAMLSASVFCAKLGAMLSCALLVVSASCKLGPRGCAAGVPAAAVVAGAMAVVWWMGQQRDRAAVARAAVSGFRRHVECLCRRRSRRGSVVLPVTTRRS